MLFLSEAITNLVVTIQLFNFMVKFALPHLVLNILIL